MIGLFTDLWMDAYAYALQHVCAGNEVEAIGP